MGRHRHIAIAHSHASDEHRLLLALSLTGGFMIAEVIGGIFSGSLALLADAGHMLTDTVSLFLAWFAARLSRRPADTLRSYGYHRIQILTAFLNGVFFILIVAWIIYEAIQRLMQPVEVLGGIMLTIASLGLVVNLLAFWILHSGDRANLNMRAATLHVLGDLLSSIAAIIAAVVILSTGWLPIDPLLSIFVALLILRSAWYVVKESAHILLEGTPQDVDVQLLKQVLVDEVPCIRNVHHVHVWSLTPDRPMLTLHVTVDEKTDPSGVLGRVKDVLTTRFHIHHSTIQVESGDCADK
ncbi:MAG: cation diffusion facilitator family transporter [Proteobacteria bacterium]|jgi:cobalt-zinc-cadmium efflux system protein|nr:cation diffusion facilitator family transporter [Pseudomonadota bacterium]